MPLPPQPFTAEPSRMATVFQKRVHWKNEMVQLPPNNGMLHFPQHRRVRTTPLTSAIKLSPKRVYCPTPPKRTYPIYAPSVSSSSSSSSSSSMNAQPSTSYVSTQPPLAAKVPHKASPYTTAAVTLAPRPPPTQPAPRVSIHRALRMGTCTPLHVSSTSKRQWEACAHERACHPPLRRLYILVEASLGGRYNIEVTPHNMDGFVTVGDVFQRTMLVLRDHLKLGGEQKTCSCGSPLDGAHSTESSQFLGLTVRSPEGDQSKWKLHLKLGRIHA
ncbi:hypothetical protein CPB85DRAFT_1432200 [Mucidula mucida]|nr:hypothetical protein CPB85DRAFT_1432200 [Mucidula mucida]